MISKNSTFSSSSSKFQNGSLELNGHHPSRISEKISLDRHAVYELLKTSADELNYYYSCIDTKSCHGPRFCRASSTICRAVTIVKPITDEVSKNIANYDFDPQIPGNGIRSIISVVDLSVLHLIRILKDIREQRNSFIFRASHYVKELEAYVSALVVLMKAIERVYEYLPLWPKTELFSLESESDPKLIDLMSEIESLDQSAFFGRTIGFQFCASMSRAFQLIGLSLASYSLLWDSNRPAMYSVTGAASNLLTSGNYLINPEERAKRIYQVTINADIAFCKAFWNLVEAPMLQDLPRWVSPHPSVNEMWHIPGDLSLYLETNDGNRVEVPPPSTHNGPKSIPMRVISFYFREGMATQNVSRLSKATGIGQVLPRSPCLLFHVHGGGFVATSSKTHEPYLRHWAKSLNCPVVSVDYSLAPESPYPRATEEILYSYAWVLANAGRLGWTGERICFVGDSAGGLILASTVLRLIKQNMNRLPDGMVLIYPAFLAQYSPSPSRLLSLLDPLLPLGIVTRCLAAYTGNLDYLKNDIPLPAQCGQHSRFDPFLQSQSDSPSKPTLRDVVDGLYQEQQLEPASVSTLPSGLPGKSVSGVELASDAGETEEPSKEHSKNGTAEFILESSSSDEGENDFYTKSSSDSFLNGQLSQTNSQIGNIPSTISIGLDPNCITFATSCFDDSFLNYLHDQESIKTSFRKFTAPVMREKSPSEEIVTPASSRQPHEGSKEINQFTNRSRSTGSLANLTRASAAMGHRMGMYLVDNISGWFNGRQQANEQEDSIPSENTPKRGQQITSPLAKFHYMPVPKDPFLSPLLASEEWLAKFPRTSIVACHLDPLLDDSVTFAKRLRRAGADVSLDLMESLPHGFLNFAIFSSDCREGARVCSRRMREMLKINRERS